MEKLKRGAVAALIMAGSLFMVLSVSIVWLNRQVVDTDTYVSTVAPLSSDPAIQAAVAGYLTNELFTRSDAEQRARDALPDEAKFLAAPLVDSLKGFVQGKTQEVLASSRFSQLWREANRASHEAMLAVLMGNDRAVSSSGDQVTLNLNPLLGDVRGRLDQAGITIFDQVSLEGVGGQFVIFQSPVISQARRAVDLLNRLAFFLPPLTLICFGAAIWLSRNRRTAVMWTGLGIAISMVVLQLGLTAGRSYYLDTVTGSGVDRDAAAAFFDTIVSSLRISVRGFLALGLVVAAGAVLAGPSRYAVALRQASVAVVERSGKGADFGPAGSWVAAHKGALRIAGLLVTLAVLTLIGGLTITTVIIAAVALLAYLGMVELVGRESLERK